MKLTTTETTAMKISLRYITCERKEIHFRQFISFDDQLPGILTDAKILSNMSQDDSDGEDKTLNTEDQRPERLGLLGLRCCKMYVFFIQI